MGGRLLQRGGRKPSVEDLIEAQRRLARSKNLFERVVGSLCIGAILKEQLIGVPNSTISQLLTDQVWSQLNCLGPEFVIVEIASERLRHPFPMLVKSVKENPTR
jgi:hypothetical protein